MARLGWASFFSIDSRGNRLLEYRSTRTPDGSRFFIETKCCPDVGHHVRMALEGLNPVFLEPDPDRWTHRYEYQGPYTYAIQGSLEVLKTTLTLRKHVELDGALALDFYKIPDEEVPPEQWSNTDVGRLVNRGKYSLIDSAGSELANRMTQTIRGHRYYAATNVVVSIPGTNHQFGERLAGGVAARLGTPCIPSRRMFVAPHPAKEGRESHELEAYEISGDVRGKRVVIVDDVYRSGVSLRSVAAAARTAGAAEVLGVVGARTLRN